MELTTVVRREDGELGLIARARQGDRDAFARLVAARADRVLRIARAILRSEPEAHDAAQNAFVSAWINLPRLRDLDRFDPWLNRILRNACVEGLRQRRTTQILDLTEVEATPTMAREASDPADRLESTTIKLAFRRLSADDRTILLLHHLHDMPLSEVARQLAIPEGTAKSRLWAARRALERALETQR